MILGHEDRQPRSRSRAGKSLATGALLGLLCLAGIPSASAQAALRPYVDCVAPETPSAGKHTVYYGYVNDGTEPQSIPGNTPNNYTTPTVVDASRMPSVFQPGWHPRALAVVPNSAASVLTWILQDGSASAQPPGQLDVRLANNATAFMNATPICGPHFTGAFSPTRSYIPQEIVYHEGGSWIAKRATTAAVPADGPDWAPFAAAGATGQTAPRGAAGASGPAGAAGSAGASGPKGDRPQETAGGVTAGAPQRLGRTGRLTVRDRRVRRASTIVIQYADSRLRKPKPTNVTSVRNGRFTVSGSPRARFTYVVHGVG